MTRAELLKLASAANCKIIGAEHVRYIGERQTLAALVAAFNNSESHLLCEPSLARRKSRRPDIVLIDVEIGVCVFEVKGLALDRIEKIEAGGVLHLRYGNGTRANKPIAQACNTMFEIKDATKLAFNGEIRVRFEYRVVFPAIRREEWHQRFGPDCFCPPEFLFADDLVSTALAGSLGATDRVSSNSTIRLCPLDQLQCVWRAFGDTSVLYWEPDQRITRPTEPGTLGRQFDEAAEAYKSLSEDQQRLSAMDWQQGPRVVRGVAGSGKTVVLANNLARRLERMLRDNEEIRTGMKPAKPRLLAVCFNRTLAPLIRKKIEIAFQQRAGAPLPAGSVEVCSFNTLMYRLMRAGLWKYQSVRSAAEIVLALNYLEQIDGVRQNDPLRLQRLAYDAIYVDEGQDFHEQEFVLLKQLCRVTGDGEPSLFVFYDDAQNLYGRPRPNWMSIGLNVRGGRSFVMTQCFRNTRPIVEAAFNVLYGSRATGGAVPGREFADLTTLEQKGLIEKKNEFWQVRFAPRGGRKPIATFAADKTEETNHILGRLCWLIETQQVRPEDILVLTFTRHRAAELAGKIEAARIPGVGGVHLASAPQAKDSAIIQPGKLTVSTLASAKGYDAYCVLIATAHDIPIDIEGRAHFYVGCTRAIEYLEVFSQKNMGLAAEFAAVITAH